MDDSYIFSDKNGKVRHFERYRQIALVLVKYRLGGLIKTLGLDKFLPFRLPIPHNPWRKETRTASQRVRLALEELGTSFVKVGQILSTRSDILPKDFAQELTSLQSCLPPIPVDSVKQVIQEELGRPVEELFGSFDPTPVGVASIGQAHVATLQDGTEVVVKTRKPHVLEQVEVDLDILRQLANSATQRGEKIQEYDPSSLVEEVADTLEAEMDYVREGRSGEHFADFFKDDPTIHIPKIFWEYTTSRVITLERIRGIGILDINALDAAGFNRQELATRSVDIWLRMVFEDTVFHADPHPGNLFAEEDGRLGLIDFGMVGIVDDDVRNHITSSIKAIMDRDADLLVDSLTDLGALTPFASRDKFSRDIKRIMSHYPVAIEDLNLEVNLSELFNVVRRNHVVLPSNTFLLLKTMVMVQSMGKELDPQFDFFSVVAPEVEDLLKNRYMPSAMIRRLPSVAAELAIFGMGLPRRLLKIIKGVERGELQVRTDVSGVELHLVHLERIVNRLLVGLIVAFIILAGAIAFLALRLG